jgi:hypothetical protein
MTTPRDVARRVWRAPRLALPPANDRALQWWSAVRDRLEAIPTRWYAAPTIGIFIGIALSTVHLWPEIWYERGTDYGFMMSFAQRWLDGGGFYAPNQVGGPYVGSSFSNFYPPPALLLFAPFTFLPGPLWWAVPLGAIALHVWSSRPAPWVWPVLALLCYAPRTQSIVIWGNTTMWVAAFVALGLRFAWPSVLILIKPYFAPFVLIGFGRRAWVVSLIAFATVNVVLLPVWVDYLAAWRNAASWPGLGYSPADFLMVSIPVVAWLARRRDRHEVAGGRLRTDVRQPAG